MDKRPIRHSHLKEMAKSPAHFRIAVERGDDAFASPAMEFGTAVHSLVLGGKPVIYYPGKTRRGAEWDKFEAENADSIILSRSDYDRANLCADSVRASADAVRVLDGRREQKLAWSYLGRECQSTPDNVGDGLIADLKTCRSANPDQFGRDALRMMYHSQLAFYREAVRSAGICDPTELYLVAVESQAPFPVTVLRLTDRAVEAGDRLWRSLFERVLAHEAIDSWPGYSQTIVDLDVPEEQDLDWGDDEPETEAA